MAFEDQVKAFGMTNMLIETDLEEIEKNFQVKIRPIQESLISTEIESDYFPQFEKDLRKEAAEMAKNYELFSLSGKNNPKTNIRPARGSPWR